MCMGMCLDRAKQTTQARETLHKALAIKEVRGLGCRIRVVGGGMIGGFVGACCGISMERVCG